MKLFKPWTWFNSDERKEQINTDIDYVFNTSEEVQENPVKNTIYMNGVCTIVYNDFSITTQEMSLSEYQHFKSLTSKSNQDWYLLTLQDKNTVVEEKPQQIERKDLFIFNSNEDFEIVKNDVFLLPCKLKIPDLIVGSFIEILERKSICKDDVEFHKLNENYQALKMFWYWAALNPVESSREDLFKFVEQNDIKITSNGLLEMYRRVVSVGEDDKEFINFISFNYFRIKKNKKSPSNYTVYKEITLEVDESQDFDMYDDENEYPSYEKVTYGLVKTSKICKPKFQETNHILMGTLNDEYLNLPKISENTYTDAHTKSKSIVVGSVYKEDEDKIDLDNTRDCSNGLHVGSSSFMFNSFGDTGVMALVNPSKVRSVPVSAINKMRVSEMFICAVLDVEDYKIHVNEDDLTDYSEEYYNNSLEELQSSLQDKTFELKCQEEITPLDVKEIKEVVNMLDVLKSKVVENK